MTGRPPAARRVSATLVGFLLIGATLAVLVWLPPFFQKRSFRLNLPDGETAPKAATLFPMDQPLALVWSGGKAAVRETTTLRKLAGTRPGGVIVNFWATWCPPCLEEMPSLEAFARQLATGSDTLPLLVAISVDDKAEEVTKLFRTLGYPIGFPVLHDPGAVVSQTVGTSKYPETYWVGSDGYVRQKWVGPQNWLSREVLQALRGS